MKFVPTSTGEWFKIKNPPNPDEAERNFLRNAGEFSFYRDESFEKHCRELARLNKFYHHLNGTRLKRILHEHDFWYGRSGFEELIYGRRKKPAHA